MVVVKLNSVLVDLADKSVLVRFGRHPFIDQVAVSKDGKWVATGTWRGYGVRVWDTKTGQLMKTLIPKSENTVATFSPDGSVLAAADGDSMYLGQCESWEPIEHEMQRGANGMVGRLRFAHNASLLAADKTRFIPQLISFRTTKSLATFEAPYPEKLQRVLL